MAQDKTLESYTGLFYGFAILLLAIDLITLGNLTLHNIGVDYFTPLSNFMLTKGWYSNEKYYILRLCIVGLVFFATFLGKPKKVVNNESTSLLVIKAIIATLVFIFSYFLFLFGHNVSILFGYTTLSIICFALFTHFYSRIATKINSNMMNDRFGKESRKFDQTLDLKENEYSVNLKTDDGYINVVNPFRASLVIGTPGSGKSFAILNQAIIQHIQKGFAMCVYDYKFPALTTLTYNTLMKYNAVEMAKAIMIALNPSWNKKQGDFFVESPINYVASLIWALRSVKNGKYCSLPHLIQLLSKDYDIQFTFLASLKDETINNMAAPFLSAHEKEATDQLEGQIASARLTLSRLTSPVVYWVMTTTRDENGVEIDGINLQINDPNNPKVLCIGNNPDRQEVYSVCISLFTTKMLRLINKKKMQKCAVVLDELTTMSFPKGTIDNVIATGRSNKIAVWLGFQDLSQAIRDFSKENADAIINTVGNWFSGQVSGQTAQTLSRMFGKIKVQKESKSVSDSGVSFSYSEQMEDMIPESEIQTLSQGVFVGKVADNFGEEIEQKFFHSKIHVDLDQMSKLESGQIPNITDFLDENNNTLTDEQIDKVLKLNLKSIVQEVDDLLNEILYK